MPCYQPISAWRPLVPDSDGKRKLRFGAEHKNPNCEPIEVACGKCIGCRLERSRTWALRCVHELQQHEDSMFITLTYDERHIPKDHSLDIKVWQKFMYRLRQHIKPARCRFFAAGEYGQGDELNKLGRPHYHAIIFGYRFPDMVLWKTSKTGHDLMMSEQLNKLWPYGNANIGQVSFESCAYVARYVTKKINGDAASEHYTRIDPITGEHWTLLPEFSTCSRRPGIGKGWLDKYSDDIERNGYIYERGHKMSPPRYYQGFIKESNPEAFEKIQIKREEFALANYADNTSDRLAVREEVKSRQMKHFQRGNANYDH